MAGMLPGVEAARRRRFHQKNNHFCASELSPATTTSRYGSCSTRRSSLCLYVSSHEFRLCSSNSSMQRSGLCDESRLGVEAREAKKRLDERLQAKWRSETTRGSIGESRSRSSLQEMPMQGSEVPKMKKNGSTKLRWLKLSWKSSEQEECAVCLEQLKAAAAAAPEALMQLGCGHRFHRNCLVPWLEANGPCPCCRTEVPS